MDVNPGTQTKGLNVRQGATAFLLLFYLGLSLLTAAVSFDRKYPVHYAAERQSQAWDVIRSGGALYESDDINLAWYAKRPLMPALSAILVKVTGLTWAYAFSLLRLGFFIVLYPLFDRYLRLWFKPEAALAGTLLLAAALPLTFKDWWEIPTDIPEILFFTVALACIQTEKLSVLPLITCIAALNRETAVYMPFLAAITSPTLKVLRLRAPWITAAFVAWAGVFFGVHAWTGIPTESRYAQEAWGHFLTGIGHFLVEPNPFNNFLFYGYLFGALWLAPLVAWRRLPVFLRRATLLLPIHVLVAFFGGGGRVDEPRHLCLLFPIVVPIALFALLPWAGVKQTDAPAPSHVR